MRAHKLLQPTRGRGRRRRPGLFRVTRPDELWHLDMTKVWTAQHGWVYLHARDFRRHLSARGITHRRGGYRDPESQAFIESWFGQFKKRCAWRAEWETLDQARAEIAAYVDAYHHWLTG